MEGVTSVINSKDMTDKQIKISFPLIVFLLMGENID
jgi:hypothetical protein